jgi:hypothetical protein
MTSYGVEEKVKLTVVDIISNVWEAIDSPLTNNAALGGPGGGLAIFPDRPSPLAASGNYDRVRVKAFTTPAVSNLPIYFTSYDVDDPSANDPPVDYEAAGLDNRGSPFTGTFLTGPIVNSGTDGVAVATFKVSMKPGDNYRIVGSLFTDYGVNHSSRQNCTNGVVVDAGDIEIPKKYATDMLTVWRHLWVERDTMSAANIDTESIVGEAMKSSIQPSNAFVGTTYL